MTKLEEVARAICTSQTQTDKMWQAFLPEATAAIEAMRVPTEAMLEAAWTCTKNVPADLRMAVDLMHTSQAHKIKMKHRCAAMIDAALNERPSC